MRLTGECITNQRQSGQGTLDTHGESRAEAVAQAPDHERGDVEAVSGLITREISFSHL